MPALFIDDGYTVTDKIEHTADGQTQTLLSFSFRPMRGALRQQLVNAQIALRDKGFAGLRRAAEMTEEAIAGQIVSWDALDKEGKTKPINAATVGGLGPLIFPELELKVLFWADEGETAKN